MPDMATFYKKGNVLHATECFIDGKRVPTKAEIDAGTAQALVQYVLTFLALVHVFSDGCARQYAGRKNYFKVAEFFSLLGLILLQHTAEAHCFKGVWDGRGKYPKKGGSLDGPRADSSSKALALLISRDYQTMREISKSLIISSLAKRNCPLYIVCCPLPVAYCPLAAGCLLLSIGCCLLVIGCCLLYIGYWLFAIGYWLLSIVCCLLAIVY
jgi:hypothetical protein